VKTAEFKTSRGLKAYIGSLRVENHWHRRGEQSQINASRAGFSAGEVNTVENIIALQSGKASVHSKISVYYSSIQDFTDGMRVRD
jgi:filamentous hemagglutinin